MLLLAPSVKDAIVFVIAFAIMLAVMLYKAARDSKKPKQRRPAKGAEGHFEYKQQLSKPNK